MINPDPDPDIIRQLEIRNAGLTVLPVFSEIDIIIESGSQELIPFIKSSTQSMLVMPIISIKIYDE